MLIEKEYIRKIQQISSNSGKSLFFCIPFDITNYLKLSKGDFVDIDVEDGKIIAKIVKGDE